MNKIANYVKNLYEIFSENLKSVFIYGSTLRYEQKDNVNLMIILDRLSGEDLRKCSKVTKKWVCGGNAMPVFITYDEWKCSADTYPMEYSDIIDFHKIIFGKDYISQILISKEDLRLQCEREIKALLMHLRSFYLANADSKIRLREAFCPCVKTFMTVFRAILRLNGTLSLNDDKNVIKCASKICGFSQDVFIALLENKTGEAKIKRKETYKTLDNLISELEILLCYVNSIQGG